MPGGSNLLDYRGKRTSLSHLGWCSQNIFTNTTLKAPALCTQICVGIGLVHARPGPVAFEYPPPSPACRTTQHNTTQHNTTQHNTTQHNTTQHNTTLHYTTQHNTTQHNTTRHNTTQHNTTKHNTVKKKHKTKQHSVVGGPQITDPRGPKPPPSPHQMIRGSRITHPIKPPPSPLPSKMIRNFRTTNSDTWTVPWASEDTPRGPRTRGRNAIANGMALTLHKLGHY